VSRGGLCAPIVKFDKVKSRKGNYGSKFRRWGGLSLESLNGDPLEVLLTRKLDPEELTVLIDLCWGEEER